MLRVCESKHPPISSPQLSCSFQQLNKTLLNVELINQNLSLIFHCYLLDVVAMDAFITVSSFCGLTVGSFPLSPTHWPSRVEVMGGYHEYTDVKSCQDVVHLYHLLWSATILNIVALFLGIITAAVLGGFKDMVRLINDTDICTLNYFYIFDDPYFL